MKQPVTGTLLLAALLLLVPACGPDEPEAPAGAPSPAAVQAGSAPRIEFAQPQIDLGEIAQGATGTATLVVRNTGEGVLAIESAKGS